MAEPNGQSQQTAVARRQPDPAAPLIALLERAKPQIALALPRHLTPDRMVRLALTTLRRTPALLKCDPLSVVGAVVQASQLGLEIDPTLGHAYLVPFKGQAQLIVGYKGYLALARRSGEVTHFSAHVVGANDRFEFAYGSEPRLVHQPDLDDPGEPRCVYAVFRTRDGSCDFEVIGWGKILRLAQEYGTKPGSPWKSEKHLPEMARKTAIRALAKRAPLSAEMARAASVDEDAEDGRQSLAYLAGAEAPQAARQADPLAARLGGPVIEDADPLAADRERLRGLRERHELYGAEWELLAQKAGVPYDEADMSAEELARALAAVEGLAGGEE